MHCIWVCLFALQKARLQVVSEEAFNDVHVQGRTWETEGSEPDMDYGMVDE